MALINDLMIVKQLQYEIELVTFKLIKDSTLFLYCPEIFEKNVKGIKDNTG